MATDWSESIAVADLDDEPALSEELAELIDRLDAAPDQPVPHVVLNFAAVNALTSSTISQLLRLRQALQRRGRKLRLCSLSDQVWSVMLLTGLDAIFDFADDTGTALASLQLEDDPEQSQRAP